MFLSIHAFSVEHLLKDLKKRLRIEQAKKNQNSNYENSVWQMKNLTLREIASLFIVYVFPESANESESMLKLRDKCQLHEEPLKPHSSLFRSR